MVPWIREKAKKRTDTAWESALFKSANRGESALLAGDVGDHVTNRLEFLGFFVGDLDVEFLFKGHHKLNGVERVGSEVFDEFCFECDLVGIYAELVYDDIFYAGFDAFIRHEVLWFKVGVGLGYRRIRALGNIENEGIFEKRIGLISRSIG